MRSFQIYRRLWITILAFFSHCLLLWLFPGLFPCECLCLRWCFYLSLSFCLSLCWSPNLCLLICVLYASLSLCLNSYLFLLCLGACVFVRLSFSLCASLFLWMCVFVCMGVSLSVYLSLGVSACVKRSLLYAAKKSQKIQIESSRISNPYNATV